MFGIGREALPDVQEWSGVFSGCLEAVGRPSRMSGSDQEALPDVQEALSNVRECSEGPPGYSGGPLRCPGVVERPSLMSKSGRVTLSNVREWLETLLDVREWLGVPPGCPRGFANVRDWS